MKKVILYLCLLILYTMPVFGFYGGEEVTVMTVNRCSALNISVIAEQVIENEEYAIYHCDLINYTNRTNLWECNCTGEDFTVLLILQLGTMNMYNVTLDYEYYVEQQNPVESPTKKKGSGSWIWWAFPPNIEDMLSNNKSLNELVVTEEDYEGNNVLVVHPKERVKKETSSIIMNKSVVNSNIQQSSNDGKHYYLWYVVGGMAIVLLILLRAMYVIKQVNKEEQE